MKSDLFLAAEEGNISAFRKALVNGADINQQDENGITSFMIACKLGHLELAKFILNKGINISIKDKNGLSCINYAEISKNNGIIEFMLQEGIIKESAKIENNPIDVVALKNTFLPTISILKEIIKVKDVDKLEIFADDFFNLLMLFRQDKKLSISDGFGFLLILIFLSDPEKFDNTFEGIDDPNKIVKQCEELLQSEEYQKAQTSYSNFKLSSYSLKDIDLEKTKTAFYEFAKILANKDGQINEQEKKTLEFLEKNYFQKHSEETNLLQEKEFSKSELDSILEELNNLVGMENIKNDIHSLINIIKINNLRKQEGLPEQKLSLHSVFMGPPGTGKTTIARILSNIYHSLEILPESNFVETDRSGLVAGYVGQTAIKTDKIINQAKNGILFIDEAYTLKRNNSDNDYGQEAIDILLKRMEDFRDNLIIIVAGYENEMNHFINSNPGLKSRFNRYFHFKDYNPTELTEIYKRIAKKSGFILKEEAQKVLYDLFEKLCSTKDDKFGNARLARNIFEKTFEKHANRTSFIVSVTREMLTTIEAIDIPIEEFSNN